MTSLPAVAGVSIDQLVGEPPTQLHPVIGFGAVMTRLEQRIYADRRANGVVMLACGIALAMGVGIGIRRAIGPTAATMLATAACAAGKMLDGEAIAIADALRGSDLTSARERLGSLVGRTVDDLDNAAISRAVIESVAENSVDAVTASLLWASVAGAPGVLAHRAINTLDAMVGHRTTRYQRFGWASARADDAVNYLPARATALAVALANPQQFRTVWRVVRRDAGRHPSPNGGVIEAAYAASLGVRLGGINRYGDLIEDRGALGDGRQPNGDDIVRAVRLRRHSTLALAALAIAVQRSLRNVGSHGAT